jgi:hypothetical protein
VTHCQILLKFQLFKPVSSIGKSTYQLISEHSDTNLGISENRLESVIIVKDASKAMPVKLIRTGFPRHFLDSLNIVVHTPLAGHDHYACVGAFDCRTSRYS